MPKRPTGDFALTPAQRNSSYRGRRAQAWSALVAVLEAVESSERHGELPELAREARRLLPRHRHRVVDMLGGVVEPA